LGFGVFLCLRLITSALADGAPEITELKSYPGEIMLRTANARQRIVVQATYADGITRDVTSHAGYALADPKLARLEPEVGRTNRPSSSRTNRLSSKWDNGQFRRSQPPRPRAVPASAKKSKVSEAAAPSTTVTSATNQVALSPLADGHTELRVSFEGRTLTVPVTVSNAVVHPPISFKLDVMPVFMKAGCNAGSCHGSSRGKDGFHLSLYGFDPDGDYHRLTREQIGRRINLAIPEESLIVQKGLGAVTHTGGVRFGTNSDLCQTLIAWLAAGARSSSSTAANRKRKSRRSGQTSIIPTRCPPPYATCGKRRISGNRPASSPRRSHRMPWL